MLFYDYFNCDRGYSEGLNLDEEKFKEIYLRALPQDHLPTLWYSLATSVYVYGKL